MRVTGVVESMEKGVRLFHPFHNLTLLLEHNSFMYLSFKKEIGRINKTSFRDLVNITAYFYFTDSNFKKVLTSLFPMCYNPFTCRQTGQFFAK